MTEKKKSPFSRPNSGGARRGAGRPKGSANKKTMEIANRCAKEGITPLEVMLEVMMEYRAEGNKEMTLDAAAKAAPYMHSKLSSVDLKAQVRKTTTELTRDELLAIAALASAGSTGSAEEGRGETESNSVH